jgi:acyl carrier protein
MTENALPTTNSGEYAEMIAGIWLTVLGLETCERKTNFFDLGGSSLKMMRVHSELQKKLSFTVSIVELFAHPDVDTLAERLVVLGAANGSVQSAFPATGQPRPASRIFRPMKPLK